MHNNVLKLFKDQFEIGWTDKGAFMIYVFTNPKVGDALCLYKFIYSDGSVAQIGRDGEDASNER